MLSSKSTRMTVRQLESMVRLSEAIAKVHFSQVVTNEHAETAVRIFNNALSKAKKEVIELTDAEDESDFGEDEETMGDAGGSGSSKLKIDSSLFVLMQNQIILRLRDLEGDLSLSPGNTTIRNQMKQISILTWYMTEHAKEVTTDEDQAAERRLVAAVLKRMIHNDVLIVESDSLDIEAVRDSILRVHPNVEYGRNVKKQKQQRLDTQFYANMDRESPTVASRSSTTEGGQQTQPLELQDHEFLSLVYPS
eukprot:Protomagalhaensia_wolfi_Nauph_80__2554@NODE_2710_length_1010_cov_3_535530_g2122_i0_p1_GENE_NODE_2710_length_1010_cov_3_535530_g2122_i0NODE_2710_length_1010_cov_3_535530_g2122_i0_p1_ORF_typecomplete_len250_score50_86MCM6_C/PF18263_1/8_2e03MCM6_C/PF18263_1/4_3e15MCM_lid/PF17855_1/1_7e14MCM_lid/PF17855_1/4e03DUF977/PF06163_11/0_099Utp12/PF04003_12/0_19_NODE_2710_length_1010_cov_3_535530_g2122_i019768